ncbi:hypothetical protein OV207_02445 [Corallococcus sp. BB11-1]|uniref:hypothetical protein n=1 Tax=Corallococcus sp. BB11-1 TaxID=2996783 RepID=UPI00226F8FC5|nr:hypothetical protein [Corallococcus sp. BB11-1]MCY1030300.1 hypothetical protein [Corallococcus sp. BB11-1]
MILLFLSLLTSAEATAADVPAPSPQQTCHALAELSPLLSESLIDEQGIKVLQFASAPLDEEGSLRVRSFRSALRVALIVELSEGSSPPGGALRASLTAPGLQSPEVLKVLQVAPRSTSERAWIIVEASASADEARGVYTLEFLDAEGTRFLVLPGVRFPVL